MPSMHTRIALFLLLTGLTALAAPALAHHGRGGTYDMKRPFVARKGRQPGGLTAAS